jgi:hypothetical protein
MGIIARLEEALVVRVDLMTPALKNWNVCAEISSSAQASCHSIITVKESAIIVSIRNIEGICSRVIFISILMQAVIDVLMNLDRDSVNVDESLVIVETVDLLVVLLHNLIKELDVIKFNLEEDF